MFNSFGGLICFVNFGTKGRSFQDLIMNEHKSIEQLENYYWKDVNFPSTLVERCFAYRKIPISDLTAEQLRLLISQQIGLPYLIARAVGMLQHDILTEGEYYPGDLLNSLISLNAKEWVNWPKEKQKLIGLISENIATIETTLNRELIRKAKAFGK